jgi:hypothetical protein
VVAHCFLSASPSIRLTGHGGPCLSGTTLNMHTYARVQVVTNETAGRLNCSVIDPLNPFMAQEGDQTSSSSSFASSVDFASIVCPAGVEGRICRGALRPPGKSNVNLRSTGAVTNYTCNFAF